jgi:hypothetical protein
MTLIIQLIAKYALWIYILCGIAMLAYVRAALAARTEGSQAMFSLEREQAAKRVYRSAGMILVLLLIVVGVYGLTNYAELLPEQAAADETPTPASTDPAALTAQAEGASITATVDATSAGAESAPEGETESTPTQEPTPTRKPLRTIAPVVVPTQPQVTPTLQVIPAACPHANVRVTQPGQNQVIDAGIEVRGTALKESFDRYEFKFQSRDLVGDDWHWVETFTTPIQNGSLGVWHTSHLPDGNYLFMLIVIDKSGNSQECLIPVIIQH